MKTQLLKQIRQFENGKKIRLNNRIYIFLVCLILATVFWFLKMLTKEYATIISFPVRYVNMPDDKILENKYQLPDNIQIHVFGNGYSILGNSTFNRASELEFDLSNDLQKGNLPNTYFIITNNRKNKLQKQMGSELSIRQIEPDTLFFDLTPKSIKKIPVKLNLKLNTDKTYKIDGTIKIIPDSVIIKGPKKIIDTCNVALTEKLEINTITDKYKYTLNLQPFDEKLQTVFSPNWVQAVVPLGQFTESSITLPVNILNKPDTAKIKLYPYNVTINFQVSLKNYDKIKANQFFVSIDYNDVVTNKTGKVPLKLNKYPYFVKSCKMEPQKVEFVIIK